MNILILPLTHTLSLSLSHTLLYCNWGRMIQPNGQISLQQPKDKRQNIPLSIPTDECTTLGEVNYISPHHRYYMCCNSCKNNARLWTSIKTLFWIKGIWPGIIVSSIFVKVTNIFGPLCAHHCSPYANVAECCTFSNEKQNSNVLRYTRQAF